MNRRAALAAASTSLLPSAVGAGGPEPEPAAVLRDRAIFSSLSASLAAFGAGLPPVPEDAPTPVVGAHLFLASGRRGPALLGRFARDQNRLLLDRLQELGITGVLLNLGYQHLTTDSRAADYRAFYTWLAEEAKRRNLVTLVECGPLLGGVAGIPLQQYEQGKRDALRFVCAELQPAYLSVANEPTIAARDTGLWELASPIGYARHVAALVDGLEPGETLLSAGVGTWEPLAFALRLAVLPGVPGLDCLDAHQYPARRDFLARLEDLAAVAAFASMPLLVSNYGLYPLGDDELAARVDFQEAFKRAAFAHWQPLEAQLTRTLLAFARGYGLPGVWAFFPEALFAALEWTPELEALSAEGVAARQQARVAAALVRGERTAAGEALRGLVELPRGGHAPG